MNGRLRPHFTSEHGFSVSTPCHADDVIRMTVEEPLLSWMALDIHNNSQSCSVIAHLVFRNVFEVVSAIFSSIAMGIF